MIKVSVLYPNTAGGKFDMGYYLSQHMPMVQQKLGPACKRMAVEEGVGRAARPGCLQPTTRDGASLFRLDGRLSDRLRPARAGDPCRYPQLHQHPAHHSDQRSQAVVTPKLSKTVRHHPHTLPPATSVSRPSGVGLTGLLSGMRSPVVFIGDVGIMGRGRLCCGAVTSGFGPSCLAV